MNLPSADILDRARRSRDPRFDGTFFIGVLSTGIYCRCICPARAATAVRYFETAAAAGAAGFRPCLRCRPEAAPGSPAWSGTSAVVRRALQLVQDGALDMGSIAQLASQVGLGVRHLNRLFLRHVGALPLAIAHTRRLHHAKQLLNDTALPMTRIALAAGFRSVRRFNETIKSTYGRTPREMQGRLRQEVAAGDEIRLLLCYRPPYDWTHVSGFLARRAIEGLEHVDAGGYSRAVHTLSGHALISVRPCPERHALELRIRGAQPRELLTLSAAVRRAFDLSADPERVGGVLAAHPLLAARVAARPGIRIVGTLEPFESCVRALLGQQVSVASGRTLVARLVAYTGACIGPTAEGLRYLFPTPVTLADFDFAALGIPRTRARALLTLARTVRDGVVRFDDPPKRIVRALMRLPGVGPWTAHYIALRGLGDPDAFMSGDLVLRRAAASGGAGLAARTLESVAEAWRPWRGYALMHLWADGLEGHINSSTKHRRRSTVRMPGERTPLSRARIDGVPT